MSSSVSVTKYQKRWSKKSLAFRGDGGKPPRFANLWGLASHTIPAGVSQFLDHLHVKWRTETPL
ncbi:hypothetical protein [Halobacillus mangrovi]|uniref:hypothetical protein n=1 Tax=Halobacillus mangrovi TaxID=402384 RepID=UPI003D976DCB